MLLIRYVVSKASTSISNPKRSDRIKQSTMITATDLVQIEIAIDGHAHAGHRIIMDVVMRMCMGVTITMVVFMIVAVGMAMLVTCMGAPRTTLVVLSMLVLVLVIMVVIMAVRLPRVSGCNVLLHLLQIEPSHPQHIVNGDRRTLCTLHLCQGVDPPDARLQTVKVGGGDEVSFIEDDAICEGDLFDGLIHHPLGLHLVEVQLGMLGIHQGHDAV